MKKYSPEMKRVLALVDELKPKFFLQGWNLDVGVHKEPDFDEPNTAAKIQAKNCYRSAELNVYPRFFKEDEKSQRDIVIHELCHIMTGIQNSLLNTARKGIQVTDAELSYAQEEETSWFAQIISSLL